MTGRAKPGITSTGPGSLGWVWASRPLSVDADQAGGEKA